MRARRLVFNRKRFHRAFRRLSDGSVRGQGVSETFREFRRGYQRMTRRSEGILPLFLSERMMRRHGLAKVAAKCALCVRVQVSEVGRNEDFEDVKRMRRA